MPRPTVFIAGPIAGAIGALLAGCSGGPHVAAPPAGLAYECAGEPARIVYNTQGYLPGSTAPGASATGGVNWRTRATLFFRGERHDLIADTALEDLRYVEAPSDADLHLVWIAEAEAAQLNQIDQAGHESPVATCRRIRSPEQAARIGNEPAAAAAETAGHR